MAIQIKKFLNIRVFLVILCIVVFVLVNSIQEDYVSLDDIPEETLTTTDRTPTTPTDTDPPTTTTPGPTIPTETPDLPDNGGITGGTETTIPAQIIPIIIASAVFALIGLLYFQKRRSTKESTITKPSSSRGLQSRRERFRTEIKTLVDVLHEYLESKRYREGVIYGFHQLDDNMKKILGIKRESHLTPKEFSNSLELPEILPYLEWIVNVFYLARYKQSEMTYGDLDKFIENLEKIKGSSKTKRDIEIIKTTEVENTK